MLPKVFGVGAFFFGFFVVDRTARPYKLAGFSKIFEIPKHSL